MPRIRQNYGVFLIHVKTSSVDNLVIATLNGFQVLEERSQPLGREEERVLLLGADAKTFQRGMGFFAKFSEIPISEVLWTALIIG